LHRPEAHSFVPEHVVPVRSSPLATGEHVPELLRIEHSPQLDAGPQNESSQLPETHCALLAQLPVDFFAAQALPSQK
jgi:hypothetical protein